MKEKITVVKVGGAVVEDDLQLSSLLRDFIAISGRKVLVHGSLVAQTVKNLPAKQKTRV